MSEGRTPTATLTQQRQLEQRDIDILHQIVIRAQNDPVSEERPKDALLQAYNEIYKERHLTQREDRVCVDVLFALLDPATPGDSLYHKFENVLHEKGIVLAFEDDATTQDEQQDWDDRQGDGMSDFTRSPVRFTQPLRKPAIRPAARDLAELTQFPRRDHGHTVEYEGPNMQVEDEYLDNPPTYITHLLLQAEARDRAVLARQTLEVWKGAIDAARERQLDARADALHAIRLKRKVLKQCIAVFQDLSDAQQQADQMRLRRLASYVLGKTSDEYRVRRVTSMDEDRLKGLCLYKWTVASREVGFSRSRDFQLKKRIFHKLLSNFQQDQARRSQLEELLAQRNAENKMVLLRGAMSFLTQQAQMNHRQEAAADAHSRNTLGQAAVNVWRTKASQLSELALTAEDAREYFLMKRVVKKLRSVTRFRKERRTWLVKWSLMRWQTFVKNRRHQRYDELYRQVRRSLKINLARKMLLRWQQKLHGQQEDDARANTMYQASLMQRVIRPVIEHSYDVAEWVKRNERVADQQAERFLHRKAMIALQMRQQSLFEMDDKADRLRQYRIEQRAVQGLRQMQLKAFELQRRHFDAEAFRSRNDKRVVRNILAKMRRTLPERRSGGEGALALHASAVTPARKREELLLNSSTRLSTTPAYTPFAVRLRQERRMLEDFDEEDDTGVGEVSNNADDAEVEP